MRECSRCGKPLSKDAKHNARFCSSACRQASYRERKRAGEKPQEKRSNNHVTVDVTPNVTARLTREDFERMMDDPYEDLLRFSRDVLKRALQDESTPSNALAPIAKQLLSVGKELEGLTHADPFSSMIAGEVDVTGEGSFSLDSI